MDRYLSFLRYLKIENIKDKVTYLNWYNFLEQAQWWSKEEISNYQWNKIKALIEYVYLNVPYYKELLNKMGAKPADFKSWDDFEKIPFLTKEIIRNRFDDLISNKIEPSKLKYYTTGGSTGVPLGFYYLPEEEVIERAFMFQQWHRIGFKENGSRMILRGEPVKKNNLFQRYRFSNNWLFSSYHISEKSIIQYVNALNSIKPDFFHVYPSSLYIFTKLLLDSGLSITFSPKAILCGSEPLSQNQRELFERTFNSKVYSWLGLAEGVIMAGECEYSTNYHIWPFYSYVEIISNNKIPIQSNIIKGEIIGTALNKYAFPFIRYRTGDIAETVGLDCQSCRRNFQLLRKIDGRTQDIIISKNGTFVPFVGLNPHSEIFDNAAQVQFVQKKPGELILKLIRGKNFSDADSVRIVQELKNKLSDEFEIRIIYVNDIPRTGSGKFRYLVQELKLAMSVNE